MCERRTLWRRKGSDPPHGCFRLSRSELRLRRVTEELTSKAGQVAMVTDSRFGVHLFLFVFCSPPPLTPPHQGVTENYLGYSPCFLRGSLLLLSVDFQVIYFNSQMIISARFDNKWGKNGFLIVSMNPHYSWLWGEKAPEWIISSHTPDSLSLLSLSCALGKLQGTSLLSSPSVAGLIRLHVN